jgi:hypothetical protein
MSQCSFFLDNLVCLDSEHAVAHSRLERSCFRSTPAGQDTHAQVVSTLSKKKQWPAIRERRQRQYCLSGRPMLTVQAQQAPPLWLAIRASARSRERSKASVDQVTTNPTKFEGRCEELVGYIYDYAGTKQAERFVH